MRAATIRDGELGVATTPIPSRARGEVLVRVRAAGMNGADLLQRRGRYPAPPGSPERSPASSWPARSPRSGRASRFGRATGSWRSWEVAGQAELATLNERAAMPVPEELDWPAAGGFAEVFTTAHDALFTQAGLRPGERLLVHGGAGGVGTRGVQLGGPPVLEVTATVRNEGLRAEVESLGATAIAPDDFADEAGPST